MAINYTKPRIEVQVATVIGEHFIFNDGASVYEALQEKRTLVGNDADKGMIYVPYHAVNVYSKQVESDETKKADPYCEGDGTTEVLFDGNIKFNTNPAGAYGSASSSGVKSDVYEKLEDGDKVWLTVNGHRVEATVSVEESGYSINKKFNLADTSYIKTASVNWESYGQSPTASFGISINGEGGTYNVKLEKATN